MTLLEKMCEELGVEIGKIWKGNDENYYIINNSGQLLKIDIGEGATGSSIGHIEEELYYIEDDIGRVLTGELKSVWKPKEGEPYYIPSPTWEQMHEKSYWENTHEYHNLMWERGLVFRSKEEAIRCAEEMIALAKQGI